MVKKATKNDTEIELIGNYFTKDKPVQFISSGCAVLDCVIGGGYPLGRVVNIVGDKSTGKTLLAIEAFANFKKQYPTGKMYYHEAEAAFDFEYAQALGMPEDVRVPIGNTIEDLFNNLDKVIKFHLENEIPGIYVVDSLDALSDKAEQERGIEEGSYAMNKQKKLGELFRRLVGDIQKTNVCIMIISQVRDNIGVMFGEKHKRSGGKALDFYASQVLWLSQTGQIPKTVNGIKRTIGVEIKAKCKKNKISLPFRECDFPIMFGYGIDDVTANLDFLTKVKGALEELGLDEKTKPEDIIANSDTELKEKIALHVKKVWDETEEGFVVKNKKYE